MTTKTGTARRAGPCGRHETKPMKRRLSKSWRGRCSAQSFVAAVTLALAAPHLRAADNVAGNLITFDNDGMWSWYMDERAIIDPTNNKLLISANSSSPVRYPAARPTGSTD